MSAAAAAATLSRAATFWADRSGLLPVRWPEPDVIESELSVRARYLANCFRELDGFLRLLLDELVPVPPGPVQRNTASKLDRMVLAGRVLTGGVPATDSARLRAIGRSAACLQHCGGLVRRPDMTAGTWMTAGWPDAGGSTLRRYPLGDRLRPGAVEVADVCGFFLRVGASVSACG